MPAFPIRLWCGYVLGTGTPLYLDIDRAKGDQTGAVVVVREIEAKPVAAKPAIWLDHAIYEDAADDFKATLCSAYKFIARSVGWPVGGGFRINFVPVDPHAPSPEFKGGSLFGAVAIGLAQAVVRAEPECLRYALRPLRPVLESVRLERVAISADYAADIDSFAPVACIADKLDSFFLPQLPERPAVCVVAMGQDLNARCRPVDNPPEQKDPARFIPLSRDDSLQVLRAYDAVDALLRLWEAQSKALANSL